MNDSKMRQYSPQTGEYSIKVKNGAGWRAYDTCRLQISVGKPYHEGAKMEATVRWAAERFQRVIVCVNDTLQRHNFMTEASASEEALLAYWEEQGRLWIERNGHLFQSLPDCSIYQWQSWRANPEYAATKDSVDLFYKQNDVFRDAIEETVGSFAQRNPDLVSIGGPRLLDCSREYLLEETAVFSLMFDREEAVDIYPGTVLLPAVLFRNNPIPGMPKGLDKGAFTRIDFKRNQSALAGKPAVLSGQDNRAAA